MWIILEMGVPTHQVPAEFDIGKDVRQGCIVSPLLFDIYAEKTMREALDKWKGGIGRYADKIMPRV